MARLGNGTWSGNHLIEVMKTRDRDKLNLLCKRTNKIFEFRIMARLGCGTWSGNHLIEVMKTRDRDKL